MTTQLKKLKKTDLVNLIEHYEEENVRLQQELDVARLNTDDDSKTIQYLKRRLECVLDSHRRQEYMNELTRLTVH